MSSFKMQRTSYNSAEVIEPIVLYETSRTRKVFKAMIVREPGAEWTPRGVIVYQKRGAEGWEDVRGINLNALKSGEGVCIDLPHDQLALLRDGLSRLDRIAEIGPPQGEAEFVETTLDVKGLLAQLSKLNDSEAVVGQLSEMASEDFENLNSIIGISRLKRVVDFWEQNKGMDDEEHWQKFFESNSWILSQIFCHPLVLFSGKAYVGGKGIDNRGGKITDFIYQNNLTKNTAVIEIKTPVSALVAGQYRAGVHSMSAELTGAIAQVREQKDKFQKDFYRLREETEGEFLSFSPKCIIVCGSLEVLDKEKFKSFELFRTGLRDVEVVTYDELFSKIKLMVRLLDPSCTDSIEEISPEFREAFESKKPLPEVIPHTLKNSSDSSVSPSAVSYESEIKPEDLPF